MTFTQKKSERKDNISTTANPNLPAAPNTTTPATTEEDSKRTVTLIPFLVSSSIELSHKKPVTSLTWLANEKV